MKVVLQRVLNSSVTVNNEVIAQIGQGLLVLLGVEATDTKAQAEKMVDKIAKSRIFADGHGKTNLSVSDINGEVLIISQFTLCADTKKGNRPSFINAAPPDLALELYEYFIDISAGRFKKVEKGQFAADMKVSLVNDGPFTILMEVIT